MDCRGCREALSPYLDEQLPRAEMDAMRAHVTSCAECASRERALRAVKERVGSLPRYSAPDVLKARIRTGMAEVALDGRDRMLPTPRRRRSAASAIWAAVLIVGFLGYGLFERATRPPTARASDIVSDVLARHVRSLAPGQLTQVVSTDQHNVKPWFNGRVDVSPPVPSMDSLGFRLIGGRVDTLQGRATAVVVYARRLHSVNVFARSTGEGDLDPMTTNRNGFHLIHARRQGVDLWIVSDVNRAELEQFTQVLVRDY